MEKKSQKFRKSGELLGIICGGLLIALPSIPLVALAQQQPSGKTNPCPKIFYEPPHNNQVAVPQGCPPNDFTRRTNPQGSSASSSAPNTVPTTPPQEEKKQSSLPSEDTNENTSQSYSSTQTSQSSTTGSGEQNYSSSQQTSITQTSSPRQKSAVAIVKPTDGKVSIRLVNETNAPISYQAIGDTKSRTLEGKSDVLLQGLRIPATVTFHRQDGGLLTVTPQNSSQQGTLQLRMRETTDFGLDRSALRIEQNGGVFLN
ncbi:hypothetical protein G7B40_007915 [Aetokthonos hydrillicola Thurmond2011]|jgi:hypothetical protein|uniref:Uncharacterized protein n=1 Tax=Aetokthonos hydrillicola Thurmond2011 TaxID=2712845 RepID=A0AAP5M9K6_9CYAN|nr:hypothetical protein [Aetokthonos hydrillicola]MBO3462146.1 hypothetical protein [Aetokthonos hydrillicola CCALA 1050]MBW4587851.1 hypothetical protein [Aetokthonos hydrillicola CCALA 1050]MDR9894499.1 hypothetical protein [Aetokthonos hydrillicola Thurmond2011]